MLSRKATSLANPNLYSSRVLGESRQLAGHMRNLPFLQSSASAFGFSWQTQMLCQPQGVGERSRQTKFTNKTSLTSYPERSMSDIKRNLEALNMKTEVLRPPRIDKKYHLTETDAYVRNQIYK